MALHPSDLLKSPLVYVAFQALVGGTKMREWGLEAAQPRAGERVLDVGCGPAYYVENLGHVDYIGFDTDARYIAEAKARFPKARFFCEEFGPRHAESLGPFDAVMLMGLLHHLEDPYCDALLSLIARSLRPGGRVVALDPIVFPGQSAFSRFLSKNDRGDHVRTELGYRILGERHFATVEGRVVGDTLRCPAAAWLTVLRDPRPRPAEAATPP